MAILRILFRRGTSCRVRLMALANVLACSFVVTMTLMTTAIGYFAVVPGIFSPRWADINRALILYLFVNVCGNYLLCVFIDTSTSRARRKSPPSGKLSPSSHKRSSSSQKRSSAPEDVKADGAKVSVRGRRNNNSTREMSTGVKSGSGNRLSKNESSAQSGKDSGEACRDAVGNSSEVHDNNKSGKIHGSTERVTEDRECKTSEKTESSSKNDPALCRHSVSMSVGNGHDVMSPRATTKVFPESETSARTKATPKVSPESKDSRTEASPESKDSRTEASPESKASRTEAPTPADQPERSHECKLCEKQILRRDHHCFFMTVCIGFHNHKHFLFFCLYMMIGAFYGLVATVRFLHVFYKVRFWGPQTFIFLIAEILHNILIKGMVPTPFFAVLIYQLYVCLGVGLFAAGFLYWHLAITCSGQTTHEASAGDRRYSRGLANNLREVLGQYWPLLFLLPLPLPQRGDGWQFPKASTGARPKTKTKPEAPPVKNSTKNRNSNVKGAKDGEAVNGVVGGGGNGAGFSTVGADGSNDAGTGGRVRERRVGSTRAGGRRGRKT